MGLPTRPGPKGPTGLAILVHRGHEEADVTKGRVLHQHRRNVLDAPRRSYFVAHNAVTFSKDLVDFSGRGKQVTLMRFLKWRDESMADLVQWH